MRPTLKWLFTVRDSKDRWERSAKIAAQLVVMSLPLLAFALLWRVSNGLAVCVLMMGIACVGFLFTTWYRWNFMEKPPAQPAARRSRVSRLNAFHRMRIKALAGEDSERGETARRVIARWRAAEGSKDDEPRS